MAYVVAEPCLNCKYTDCVTVCPVECFYEAENILYIHPDECIDCGACVPECPVQAIFPLEELGQLRPRGIGSMIHDHVHFVPIVSLRQ